MNVATLSRKDRRARQASAARRYGVAGKAALDLHEGYGALARGDLARALDLAFPLSCSHPRNPHAWIILGGAALARREGATAEAFFRQASALAPGDATALTGLAKAHVLKAEVEQAVAAAEAAFAAGAEDAGLVTIYLDFMARLGRRLHAADRVEPVLSRMRDAALCLKLGEMLAEAEEPGRAARWLERAWELNPAPEAHRLARLRALVFSVRLAEAEAWARELMDRVADRDGVVIPLITALRVAGRPAEALAMAETHRFSSPESFAHSRGIVANLMQDLGREDEAEAAYLEGIHICGGSAKVAKALGVFRYRAGDWAGGFPLYAQRLPELQRRRIPLANSAPENLAGRTRLHLMAEQGIGDQLALLPLLRLAPLAEGAQVVFVGDPRLGPALAGNGLGLSHVPLEQFTGTPQQLDPGELIYPGDLTRFLDGARPGAWHGPYLRPDAGRTAALRTAYAARAGGRRVIGLAWRSGGLGGHLRSLPLDRLVQALPRDVLAVSLQYGSVAADIAAAALVRPDVEVVADPGIDQMADLAGFFAQIAAVDTVVSIDNTTVHACGALGHPASHVLVPRGSETMWYWGRDGSPDPWYGSLNLHRQARPGDWDAALASAAEALA